MRYFLGFLLSVSFITAGFLSSAQAQNAYTVYTGETLSRVAFPIGGIGTGMFCLEGTGAISHMSIKHNMEFFHEPSCYAAVCVLGEEGKPNIARVVEGPLPEWKYFGKPGSGNGSGGTTYGLPRFRECTFQSRFPFGMVELKDAALPVTARITGWSPFTPPDADASSLPVGALEYTFKNTGDKPRKVVFSFNTRNFVNERGAIGSIPGGFVLYQNADEKVQAKKGAMAIFADGEKNVAVDHCWFRGGWWDAFTVAWDNVAAGSLLENPPVKENAPGATLAVPFTLPAGGEKTIRLLMCWYFPETGMVVGARSSHFSFSLFEGAPSRGSVQGQQPVSGFLGRGLVNTYDPSGDGPQGILSSPEIPLDKTWMHLLVGGGSSKNCRVALVVDEKEVFSASGENTEKLRWVSWDLTALKGKKGVVKIIDLESGGWGHILCDHVCMSNEDYSTLRIGEGNAIVMDPARVKIIADFEGDDFGDWKAEVFKNPEAEKEEKPVLANRAEDEICACPPGFTCPPGTSTPVPVEGACPPGFSCEGGVCTPLLNISADGQIPNTFIPWYATQFSSVQEVAELWRKEYAGLKTRSMLFAKTFYDSSLPPDVVESVAANLTIMKSPTVKRQHDGRLWAWEGCGDGGGCCDGSCTHVWNYAQAFCHLFPSLERTFRQTEYYESSADGTGRQAFRSLLPHAPGGSAYDAADGQLGGIMQVYREWRIFGNDAWLKIYWPRVTRSLDYMIEKYDPRHTGLLEEDHHNTYDINYYGPDGHCGSFYLGGLAAAIEMGTYLGEDVTFYKELLEKGKKRIIADLFNGEYFIQIVQKEGLTHNFGRINPKDQSAGYIKIAELVNEQGPKYQYGTGCLSDGILGFWMAKCCGLEMDLVPRELEESHLLAIHKYNLREDLSGHANPQRPSYALGNDGGLLLCSWPRGEKPMLPFVYSDEVWTGIEYQVAAHLMMLGHEKEGLDIVRLIRKRHDGSRRNPFNEYECGHWYARAMSSYAMLQGMTGVRYDAVTKTLIVETRVPEFRSFLATATGYGTVVYKDGKAELIVAAGEIPVEKIEIR